MSCGVGPEHCWPPTLLRRRFLGRLRSKAGGWTRRPGWLWSVLRCRWVQRCSSCCHAPGLRFSISGSVHYETLYEYGDDAEEIHRRTAYWLEEFWSSNQATIDGLYPWFTVAAVALAVELVLWAVNLAGIV